MSEGPSSSIPFPRVARSAARGILLILLLLAMSGAARGQANFAFWLGGTAIFYEEEPINWGTSVGATGKFNITPIFLLRGQFNVDRGRIHDVRFPGFSGDQTVTFVCLGTGPELDLGTKDFNVILHAMIHGNIRTTSRIVTASNGEEQVWTLTRFSMGVLAGFGFEAYITDNIGFEMQGQYNVFNFDHTESDPPYKGMRGLIGVQFYLGRNFTR